MVISLEQLQELLDCKEDEHLEFKEAKNTYDSEKLVKYCVALANEGGGKLILGVTDKIPRRVVGSQAFKPLTGTKVMLIEKLHIRIDATEVAHPDGRVIVFDIPPRPIGVPISYKGAYWMRRGDELVAMTPDLLKRIFDEGVTDFSAEICRKASFDDLDPESIEDLRNRWLRKSGNEALKNLSDEQLLADAELIVNGEITYAALIMLGTRRALGQHLAQAEVIFEYRSSEASGPAQQRKEYRQGFLSFLDDLWKTINLRNDLQHFQDGLYVWDIPTFNETVAREAILNAVCHRDYRLAGSIFVRQYARRLEIVSPGGFPPGITPENFLWRQAPRNRRIAQVAANCGLAERAGQGINLMFEQCIRESKSLPDFSDSDDYEVSLTLPGQIQDAQFLRFLEKIGRERFVSFTTQDLLILDLINREQKISEELKPGIGHLAEEGIIEKAGRGRGVRYILSRQFYKFLGKSGVYTRKKGLDRETNKALLLKHLRDSGSEGSVIAELLQVLPFLSHRQVQRLMQELKSESRAYTEGKGRALRWYAEIAPENKSK